MDQKWYQVLVQDLDENVDENLAWLIQKTKDQKMYMWLNWTVK